MFQWHIHDNPVYPQNLLRTKGALGDLKKMALGGISVVFLGDPQRPHGISEVLKSFDSQSQHALVSSAARVIYSQLPSSCEQRSQIRGLFKRDIWFERETCGEKSVQTEKNQVVLWQDCESCWCSVELPDILDDNLTLKHHVFRFSIFKHFFLSPQGH